MDVEISYIHTLLKVVMFVEIIFVMLDSFFDIKSTKDYLIELFCMIQNEDSIGKTGCEIFFLSLPFMTNIISVKFRGVNEKKLHYKRVNHSKKG